MSPQTTWHVSAAPLRLPIASAYGVARGLPCCPLKLRQKAAMPPAITAERLDRAQEGCYALLDGGHCWNRGLYSAAAISCAALP